MRLLNSPKLLCLTIAAFGALVRAPGTEAVISITEPWVRATPGGHTAEVFMKLQSSDPATLVGVDSFAARSVSIQQNAAGPPLRKVDLPPNTLVELTPHQARIR